MTVSPDQFPGFSKPPSGQPQQGQLFPSPKPVDEHRWPKGYSPERSAEVDAHVTTVGSTRRSAPVMGVEIADAIKRSSAPVVKPIAINVGASDPVAGGRYFGLSHDYGEASVYSGNRGTTRPDAELTALHELGHHHSASIGTEHGYPKSNKYTPEKRGVEEAYADDFMTKHYVPRRQDAGKPEADPQRHTSFGYEAPSTWRDDYTESPAASHSAYMGARTTMSDRSMASARQPEAPFQGRLFARPVSSYVTDTEKDYGQWGYTRDVSTTAGERHTEGPMDTIKIGNGPPPRSARMKPGVPAPLTDALGNDDQKIEDYKGLNELRRSPLKSMDAYGRYGDYSGIRNAVDDWKAGEFR